MFWVVAGFLLICWVVCGCLNFAFEVVWVVLWFIVLDACLYCDLVGFVVCVVTLVRGLCCGGLLLGLLVVFKCFLVWVWFGGRCFGVLGELGCLLFIVDCGFDLVWFVWIVVWCCFGLRVTAWISWLGLRFVFWF